jgi:pimeloyl-ACP methyl ester carboxylesterase
MPLTERVEAWRRRGAAEEFRGRRIHVMHRSGRGPLLVLLHGFPSSSYDWRRLGAALAIRDAA